MRNFHPDNERVKHDFFFDMREAEGFSADTIDAIAKAIARYEQYTGYKDFRLFHREQVSAFKNYLAEQKNERTGVPLSKSTLHATLFHLRRFHVWLAMQPGYKSKIKLSNCAYFKLSRNDARTAAARRAGRYPTPEQLTRVLEIMPHGSILEMRDRALIAFTWLTGARVRAVASFRIVHVDLENNAVEQDSREVETKWRKSFRTEFFPVGEQARSIVAEWIRYLKVEEGFTDNDPLFPRSATYINAEGKWVRSGFERKPWKSTGPIRAIFHSAFAGANLPYFNPHSLRKTLVHLGRDLCQGNLEAFTAWSQNLGHEDIRTTIGSYGEISSVRQAEIFRNLSTTRAVSSSGFEDRLTNVESILATFIGRAPQG